MLSEFFWLTLLFPSLHVADDEQVSFYIKFLFTADEFMPLVSFIYSTMQQLSIGFCSSGLIAQIPSNRTITWNLKIRLAYRGLKQ